MKAAVMHKQALHMQIQYVTSIIIRYIFLINLKQTGYILCTDTLGKEFCLLQSEMSKLAEPA